MSNPVAGQDFIVNMVTTEDLTNATVTIEYKTPNGTVVTGVTPTSVNVSAGIISYLLQDSITVNGIWFVGAKIVDASGNISFVNPPLTIKFENKFGSLN